MQFRPVDEVVKELYIRDARQEGRQEGWQEGKQEGKQEGMFEAAQNLLKRGFPVKEVVEGIGLTLEEFNELRRYAELKSARADPSLD